ncbi:CwfJ C-terminus 1-domain-containing protein-like protein [Lactarius indigo]|nr:CwfJ C-terminus 1-domain-containing protein-like protein [Lactarius indigo]
MGSIPALFDKMSAIQEKHGPFNLALCVGDFFGPSPDVNDGSNAEKLLSGQLQAPLPCYIMQGEHPMPEIVIEQFSRTNGELCDNIFLLTKSQIMTTAEGLRIACLGGTYKPEIYLGSEIPHGFSSPYYTSRTVSKLLSNAVSSPASKAPLRSSTVSAISSPPLVDVFISHDWPSAVTELSSVPLPSPELPDVGSPPIDEIIERTKPRYIFSSGGGKSPRFWEREPFTWTGETDRVCRFVGLGAFGGEPVGGKKQRWFYAFAIAPQVQTKEASSRPTNATPNPFTKRPRAYKRPLEAAEDQTFRWENVQRSKRSHTGEERDKPPPGYRCKRCDSTDHFINSCPERAKPPENYICRTCHNQGHFVRDCPTRHAVGDTGGRKPHEGYVCRACGSELHYIKDCPIVQERRTPDNRMSSRRGPTHEVEPDECWFCLSNPALTKHLIVTIGEECYLTFPKGKLMPTQNPGQYQDAEIPNVPGGGHVLIVPIAHCMTLDTVSSELRTSVLGECDRYQAALRALYAKYDATAVFFETGRISGRGGHAHIQAVPLPLSLQDRVETAFRDAGKLHGIEFNADESDNGERESYFRVELPSGRRLAYRNQGGLPFSVQFGRNVLASLLKIDERADWKTCLQSEEDDKADVLAFKTAFSPFDPSR